MSIPRIAAFCALLCPSVAGYAEVIRFDVLRSVPAFEGRSFGDTGTYVKITARATIAVDPADPRNAVIADIDRAPRNTAGRVEAVADVVVLRPADMSRGNGTLLVDIRDRFDAADRVARRTIDIGDHRIARVGRIDGDGRAGEIGRAHV